MNAYCAACAPTPGSSSGMFDSLASEKQTNHDWSNRSDAVADASRAAHPSVSADNSAVRSKRNCVLVDPGAGVDTTAGARAALPKRACAAIGIYEYTGGGCIAGATGSVCGAAGAADGGTDTKPGSMCRSMSALRALASSCRWMRIQCMSRLTKYQHAIRASPHALHDVALH